MADVLALIPARSGSKGVPNKNVRLLAGKPLLAWSVEQARAAATVSRVVVSTDSPVYAEIARSYGAETPFLRPAEIARDQSTDLEVFQHALGWLREHEGYEPQVCVHLRPTSPLRRPGEIDAVVGLLAEHPEADSVRTVSPSPATPYKMWFVGPDAYLSPAMPSRDLDEPWNMPRQSLPVVYLQNACIDAVRTPVVTVGGSMTGTRILGYVMPSHLDIDTEEDFLLAEERMRDHSSGRELQRDAATRIFCFDIDGVIASITPGNDYRLASPMAENIALVNRLHDLGHRILLFTARGSMTGIDWKEETARQMRAWGVRHHQLIFGKPAADFYIDDRILSLDEIKQRYGEGGD
jgi:CMP-N-acetylneuraminic acid synthetase